MAQELTNRLFAKKLFTRNKKTKQFSILLVCAAKKHETKVPLVGKQFRRPGKGDKAAWAIAQKWSKKNGTGVIGLCPQCVVVVPKSTKKVIVVKAAKRKGKK